MSESDPVKLFISYSHADTQYKDDLLKHLKPLQRSGLIEEWHDQALSAGDHLDTEILRQLDQYDIILFLVSPDFLNSDYCVDIELATGLKRLKHSDARIYPVIIKPCLWDTTELKDYVCMPKDAQPVSSFDDQAGAWVSIARELISSIEKYQKKKM
jgi:hypothetical protein